MRARVAAGAFADNVWVHRYAVAFANLYRKALDDYDAGRMQQVPKAWRLCFDTARDGSRLVLQDMLLGINAHREQRSRHGAELDLDRSRSARRGIRITAP
jgi:hypothetical protein